MAEGDVTRAGARAVATVSGMLYVVLVFIGSAAVADTRGPGRHSLDASLEDVAEYVAAADAGRVWLGEYIAALGFVLFLPFSAYVATAGVRAGRTSSDSALSVARTAAGVYVALSVAAIAALAPAVNRGGEAASSFLDLRTTLIALVFVFLAVWLLVVGIEGLRRGSLPSWLAWAAVVIGVLEIVAAPLTAYDPGFTGLPTFASFLWVLVVSVLLLRRGRSTIA